MSVIHRVITAQLSLRATSWSTALAGTTRLTWARTGMAGLTPTVTASFSTGASLRVGVTPTRAVITTPPEHAPHGPTLTRATLVTRMLTPARPRTVRGTQLVDSQ